MKPYVIGLLILLALQSAAISQISQVTTPPTASIAGQIKLSDKIAKGVAVILTSSNQLAGTDSTKRLSTDDDGRYKFTDLAAGTYNINVLSPGYVVFADSAVMRNGQQVTVKDAEAVERVDFTLTKGGVITGRALSVDNRPVIGEPVSAFTMMPRVSRLLSIRLQVLITGRTIAGCSGYMAFLPAAITSALDEVIIVAEVRHSSLLREPTSAPIIHRLLMSKARRP